jgi:hypothetical protein
MGQHLLARPLLAVVFVSILVAAPGCSFLSGDEKKDEKAARDEERRKKAEEEKDAAAALLTPKEQCDRVVKTVNASAIGDRVSKGPDKNSLFFEAGEGDRLAKELGAIKLADAELKKLVSDYRDNVTAYATMMRKAANSKEDDVETLKELVKEARDVAQKNRDLTGKIDKFCASQ